MKSYMLRRYHERRTAAIERLGGQCAQCGSKDDLQLDHIDWRDKSFGVSKLWSCSKERFDQEVEKCQVLCEPCHIEKSRTDISEIRGGITHGKYWAAYKKKCDCDACQQFKRDHNAKRRAARKA